MSETTREVGSDTSISDKQRAFLLAQLAADNYEERTSGELNKKMPAAAKRELQLTNGLADSMRQELAERGFLATKKDGRKLLFSITEEGKRFLSTQEVPNYKAGPAKQIDDAATPQELRDAQKAFLLLQLLDAEGQSLSQTDANKLPKKLARSLGLNAKVANFRRAKLSELGFLTVTTVGRSKQVKLLADGIDYLAAGAMHLDHAVFPLKGKTTNALVSAAQESTFKRGQPLQSTANTASMPSKADLEGAVVSAFEDLLSERHSRNGLVPVHEVREAIAKQFGAAAARHDVLDDIILGLWRSQRIGLEGISDLSTATEQQLNDSIQGVNTTLFYLEVPREQPVVS